MNDQFGKLTSSASHATQLDRLAEVAVRVGLGLEAGQEVVMTAPIEALPLVAANHRTCLQGGRIAGHDVVLGRGIDAFALPTCAGDESFDTASGWLYDGHGGRLQERRRAAGHRGRGSVASRRAGYRQGVARQPGPLQGLHAGAGASSPASTSTGPSSPPRRRPGQRRCFRTIRRRWPSPSCGSDLRRLARRYARSDRAPGRRTTRACRRARAC